MPALEDHIEDPVGVFLFPRTRWASDPVVNEAITLISRVIAPFIRPFIWVTTPFITGRGPSCSHGEGGKWEA